MPAGVVHSTNLWKRRAVHSRSRMRSTVAAKTVPNICRAARNMMRKPQNVAAMFGRSAAG